MELDETTCGSVLCQHPACWQTNLRFVRKIPRTVPLPAPIPAAQEQEEEDEGEFKQDKPVVYMLII